MLFCPTCRTLLERRKVGGSLREVCPKCGPAKTAPAPRAAPARTPPARLPAALGRLFPYADVREGQEDFLVDAHGAIQRGVHLLAHAPTGIGKTVSSLVAALAVARETKKRVFFLTSKQSQHRIVVETLALIRETTGEALVVADLIAKQDMCPRPEAQALTGKNFAEFCRREQATKACDHFRNAVGSDQGLKLLQRRILHVEEAVRALDRLTICPHQATMDAAQVADVVVCDYNVLFSDMRAGLAERLQLDLADVILVVDEAHNLPDRIRDHLVLEVHERLFDEAEEELKRIDDVPMQRLLGAVRKALDALVAEATEAGAPETLVARERWYDAVSAELRKARGLLTPTDYDGLARGLASAAEAYEKSEKAPPRGVARLQQFLENWKIERRGLARILTKDRVGEWTLQYKLLDPSILAKPVFEQVAASVLMSGTLHPCDSVRDVLGLPAERSLVGLYESPFARANRLVLVDTTVTTAYKERNDATYARIADHLSAAIEEVPGHAAAFFPSYALLESVRRHLDTTREVVVEERGLDKSRKEGLVGGLRRSRRGQLLLAVQGGSLSEGYDYEDNLLKAVAIVGLPLPPPSLESDALIAYCTQRFGARGRDYAYVQPAMNRVLQAAGRLIRGPEDRGVVLLMDRRFTWNPYKASYPPDFQPIPTERPASEVREFFASRRAGTG